LPPVLNLSQVSSFPSTDSPVAGMVVVDNQIPPCGRDLPFLLPKFVFESAGLPFQGRAFSIRRQSQPDRGESFWKIIHLCYWFPTLGGFGSEAVAPPPPEKHFLMVAVPASATTHSPSKFSISGHHHMADTISLRLSPCGQERSQDGSLKPYSPMPFRQLIAPSTGMKPACCAAHAARRPKNRFIGTSHQVREIPSHSAPHPPPLRGSPLRHSSIHAFPPQSIFISGLTWALTEFLYAAERLLNLPVRHPVWRAVSL